VNAQIRGDISDNEEPLGFVVIQLQLKYGEYLIKTGLLRFLTKSVMTFSKNLEHPQNFRAAPIA
jgi:hypothetical protein